MSLYSPRNYQPTARIALLCSTKLSKQHLVCCSSNWQCFGPARQLRSYEYLSQMIHIMLFNYKYDYLNILDTLRASHSNSFYGAALRWPRKRPVRVIVNIWAPVIALVRAHCLFLEMEIGSFPMHFTIDLIKMTHHVFWYQHNISCHNICPLNRHYYFITFPNWFLWVFSCISLIKMYSTCS